MAVSIIHSQFLAKTARSGFFPSLATGRVKSVTLDGYGQPVETWSNLPELVNVGAARDPLSAQERQAARYTMTDVVWRVLLSQPAPTLTTSHRLRVDGIDYDIDAVKNDQTGTVTLVVIRQVEL